MSARDGAPNAVVRPVVDYLPDYHGGALFSALNRSIMRTVNGARAISERQPTYYGVVARDLQRFRGHAGLRAAQIYAQRSGTIQDQVTSTQSATSAVFLSRMTRGQG